MDNYDEMTDLELKQFRFEESVLLESEIVKYHGDVRCEFNLDNLSDNYNTISEITTDIDSDVRKLLYSMVYNRLKLLTPLQRDIAERRYLLNQSYRKISSDIKKSLSTINYHINKIDTIIKLT